MDGVTRCGWRRVWPFALLCVLTASRWILADTWPEMGSTLASEAAGCAVGAVVAMGVAVGRKRVRPGWKQAGGLVAVGAGLLGAPALGAALHGVAHDAFTRTFLLCFVPLIVTMFLNAGDRLGRAPLKLWPGLCGIGAAMLLFTLGVPTSVVDVVGLIGPPVAVAAGCFWYRTFAEDVAVEWQMVCGLGGGFASLAVLEGVRRMSSGEGPGALSWKALALDAMVAGLVVMAASRMEAMQYASRYFVATLLTVLEGLAIFRPEFSLRSYAGMALLAAATYGVWRGRRDAEAGLHLT